MSNRISTNFPAPNDRTYSTHEPPVQSSSTQSNPTDRQMPAPLEELRSQFTTQGTNWNGLVIKTKSTDSKSFPKQTERALDKIASKPTGSMLLNSIAESGGANGGASSKLFDYKVAISPADSNKTVRKGPLPNTRKYVGQSVTRPSNSVDASTLGKGSPSSIRWNPKQTKTDDGKPEPFIVLAHELVHSSRNLYGKSKLTFASVNEDETPKAVDEKQVVGLPPYEHFPITENAIRKEHGIKPRKQYSGLDET
jgi:hypothetical protein